MYMMLYKMIALRGFIRESSAQRLTRPHACGTRWNRGTTTGDEKVNMKKAEIIARTEELVMPIIEENHFELVDVEYIKEGGDWHLQIYADKEGGINIDDCVLISRALEKKLDEEDFIKDPYILEVSSPGLGRPLKKDKDFKRNIGKKVELKLFKAINKQKEFEGILQGYDDDQVTILEEGIEKKYNRKEIALIRQAIDF